MESYFGKLNPRNEKIRKKLLAVTPSVCSERAVLTTESYKQHEQEQVVLKRAYMLDKVLRGMSIYIDNDTLIVGNQAKADRAAPIFPEYAMDWVIDELNEFNKRPGDKFKITEKNKSKLQKIYPYWKGRTLYDKGYAAFPESARLFYDLGIIKTEGNITSGDAHVAVDYELILSEGLHGIREKTKKAQVDLKLYEPGDIKKDYFYRAILIVVDAVEAFALRYADLADKQAKTSPEKRAAELLEIARICRKVPMQKAETFYEAIQSVWFIHLILQMQSI